jgi:CDP-diacylglycerol---glycerol-3-phosphate 3-phosphatidyltransferase
MTALAVETASSVATVETTAPRVPARRIVLAPTGTPAATSDHTHVHDANCTHRECAQSLTERVLTWATAITAARTIATLVLGVMGAREHSLPLLLAALGAYWIGDVADGFVARRTHCETRIGATLDIMCDRISAAVFYIGFAWFDPTMIVPVGIYLLEFMVVDMYLSLAFLAWPVSSPNYFHLINQRLWLWNWSKVGKAINSALFAVVMVWTRDALLVGAIATVLLGLKLMSFMWLLKLQMPVPAGCVRNDEITALSGAR